MSDIRAADLPVGSVVALRSRAWVKIPLGDPWVSTGSVVRDSDTRIDEALADGAQVLRVGGGSER